jgi:isoquinoline 1-oxidoreductase/isoquinoline 1-oxidoreductase beta subunit
MTSASPTRREFLKASAITGGGLVVGFHFPAAAATPAGTGNWAPNAFLQVTPDNRFIFHCPRDEMGQGVTTGLGTLVAEELDVDPGRLEVRLTGVDSAYDNPGYRMQLTGGSNSVSAHYRQLRQVGADARALLLQAAARDLGVDVAAISTGDAQVVVSGERYPYGQFVATASSLPDPKNVPLKSPADFRYIGTTFPRLDAVEKSTGTAVYGIDVDLPGMHHAVVVRCPVAGGKLKALNSRAARAMTGVTDVIEISSGAAVVAEQFWQARKAAQALEVDWDLPELATVSTEDVRNDFAAALAEEEGVTAGEAGDLQAGFAQSDTTVDSEFWTPYLAHAPLEPMNAVARLENGKLEIWSGSQSPSIAAGLAARALDMDKDDVVFHSLYSGGGFGRRATLHHVVEAAELAAATGKPIQVLWTREDDMRHGVYRPASLMRIRAGVDEAGRITAWDARRAGGNHTPTSIGNSLQGLVPGFVPDALLDLARYMATKAFSDWTVDSGSVEGLLGDYDFPNRRVLHTTVEHGLPLTFWRSVGHSFTAFAKEVTVDELAHARGLDPVELRLRNSLDNPRMANVIRVAGGHREAAPGRATGFAAHSSFGSFVAQVAEVSVTDGQLRVHRVTCVVDCGQVINPDIVRAQMEGGIVFGLTAALHGNLELDNGAIVESNFHDYPLLRIDESPEIEVIMIPSEEDPSGVGEPGVPPIAPAVANAVFAATGQRLRSLPLRLA